VSSGALVKEEQMLSDVRKLQVHEWTLQIDTKKNSAIPQP